MRNRWPMSELKKIIIDEVEVEVDPALTIIQACEAARAARPNLPHYTALLARATAATAIAYICALPARWAAPGEH